MCISAMLLFSAIWTGENIVVVSSYFFITSTQNRPNTERVDADVSLRFEHHPMKLYRIPTTQTHKGVYCNSLVFKFQVTDNGCTSCT